MVTNLVSRFGDAGLDLRLADRPIAFVGNTDIFQLDIRRAKKHDARSEYFLAWPGAPGNLQHIAGVDRRERQLVLVVREPARAFEERVPNRLVAQTNGDRDALARRLSLRPEIIITRADGMFIRRETPGATRHFLTGRDERQLFMCQLPQPCTTVADAHAALRPTGMKTSRSAIDRPIRQGEWFFVVATRAELAELDVAIASRRALVRKRRGINDYIPRRAKAHIADEIVGIFKSQDDVRVYVRGAIRHPDHETIHIHGWRRVQKNREMVPALERGSSLFGGTWID